jgi:hypothetical protein
MYCKIHRCTHGKGTFRDNYHCSEKVVNGQCYCERHIDGCNCYWDEDDNGYPVCCEDIRQCERPYFRIDEKGRRMCQFHYQLSQFNKGAEYPDA